MTVITSREQIETLVREAKEAGLIPNLSYRRFENIDLSETALIDVNMSNSIFNKVDFSGTDFYTANFESCTFNAVNFTASQMFMANLRYSNIYDSNFHRAHMQRVRATSASFNGTSMVDANLAGSDFTSAIFSNTDLKGANFRDTRLFDACFTDAKNVPDLVTGLTSITPEGVIIGYKQLAFGEIAQLMIPADAKRSNATGRKCRCDKAYVLKIWNDSGQEVQQGRSMYNSNFIYRVGEWVTEPKYFENRWDECAPGIHFFLTRVEAENY